jgi:hypothetical protein
MTMYRADSLETSRQPTRISQILPRLSTFHGLGNNHLVQESKEKSSMPCETKLVPEMSKVKEAIIHLADLFATSLPDRAFSPAEIQGFLLLRKNDPEKAVTDAAGWRDELLAKKTYSASKVHANGTINGSNNQGLPSNEDTEINGIESNHDEQLNSKSPEDTCKGEETIETRQAGSMSDHDESDDSDYSIDEGRHRRVMTIPRYQLHTLDRGIREFGSSVADSNYY